MLTQVFMERRVAVAYRPVAVDLYCGAGGLSLGLEQAGFDVAAAAEFDPVHVMTHRYNFPTTPVLWGDLGGPPVGAVASKIRDLLGGRELDALVGGPPCQGFSTGGVRDDLDERNQQLLRFVDLVVELRPRVFCLENVAGLLEKRFDALREEIMLRLCHVGGYEVCDFSRAVNAMDYGVPQSRRRVLVMGSLAGAAPVLDVPDGVRVTVGEALEGLPSIASYRSLLRGDAVLMKDADIIHMNSVTTTYARELSGVEQSERDLSFPRVWDRELLTNSLRTVHSKATVQRFSRTVPGSVEKRSRLYRLDRAGQARTLRAGTGGDRGSHTSPRPIHPNLNRVITVREAARLHGYPDWFRFHGTNWHGHRQVGNSVPPPLAYSVGRALMQALGVDGVLRPTGQLALGEEQWLRWNVSQAGRFLAQERTPLISRAASKG